MLWKWRNERMNEWCFKPRLCTVKAILCRGQPGLMRWILVWIMLLVQGRSLDMLISSPVCYHCTTDALVMLYWYYSLACMKGVIIVQHRGIVRVLPPRVVSGTLWPSSDPDSSCMFVQTKITNRPRIVLNCVIVLLGTALARAFAYCIVLYCTVV